MDYFKFPSYQRDTVGILQAYRENQIAYLRRQFPQISLQKIIQFVTNEVGASLKRPLLEIISYPSYGNALLQKNDLLNYSDNVIRKNVITPAGVSYVQTSVKESFLKRKIISNTAKRKKEKKKMLLAAKASDLVVEQRSNYLQSYIKIETNSIPGAFGSPFNCIYDKPGYNAVTSTVRHGIMLGYSHVEKMLVGNYYFPTIDHCINYCINLARLCPPDLVNIVTQAQLYQPTVQDLVDHFGESIKLYMPWTETTQKEVTWFIASLSLPERIFAYYASCLKTLIIKNDTLFRTFLTNFFRTDIAIDKTVALDSIYTFKGDLLAMISGVCSDLIEFKTIDDAVNEDHPGVYHLIAIGHHMQACIDSIGPILAVFLRIDCDTADAMSHPNMIRKTVIISDTDSVIFSTQPWIEWYCGSISFKEEAYQINAFVVFLTTMSLEQVFARFSTNLGAQGDDIYRISMKNEFLYPLMLRTPVPKQYVGRVLIQEGFVLPKPKEDIKGLSFKSSTMSREATKAGRDFVNSVFDEVMNSGGINATSYLNKLLNHELMIINSLKSGEKTFLTTAPVREEKDYANSDVSVYYYWKLWQEVFATTLGDMIIPTKGYNIPVIGDGSVLRDPEYLTRLHAWNPQVHDKLINFMDNNKRKITQLIVPMTLKTIPPILRPLIDIRSIVYSNSAPFIITLRSLGIAYTDSKTKILLSDTYSESVTEPLAF